MDPTVRSGWGWVQTRVGQVVLFWGLLELILKALDTLTKTDLLPMLRKSLAPELQFLADPRGALFLVGFACVLFWGSSRRPKQAKSILNQAGHPQPNGLSVAEAAAIPFFLAFVCGVGLAAFESAGPSHGPARQTERALNQSAESIAPSTRTNTQASSVGPSGQTVGEFGSSEPFAHSLPVPTSAIEQEAERGDVASNERRTTSPFGFEALVTPSHSSETTVQPSERRLPTTDATQRQVPDRIERAYREKNWPLLATLCESAIAQNPQRFTPYLLAGEAYANLGQVDRAINRLEYVMKNGAKNPNDASTVRQAKELRESIRRLYGR